MLRSRLLLLGFRLTEPKVFAPFHTLVRKFYGGPLLSLLRCYLMRSSRNQSFSLVARNSVRHGRKFNAFMSDLDCAALFKAEPPRNEALALQNAFERAKTFIPSLGELEIYLTDEWKTKLRVEEASPLIVTMILELRRTVWQLQSLKQSTDPYSSFKASRAIRRNLSRIGGRESYEIRSTSQALEQELLCLANNLPSLKLPGEYSQKYFYSGYLQIGFGATELAQDLHLSPQAALIFLALLPDGDVAAPHLAKTLAELRKQPPLCDIFSDLLQYELLLVRSVLRSGHNFEGKSEAWQTQLEERLRHLLSP